MKLSSKAGWQGIGHWAVGSALFWWLAPLGAIDDARASLGPDCPGISQNLVRNRGAELFKQAELRSNFAVKADNEAFYKRALLTNDNTLYYHGENVVLKLLNEKAFGDKELSAATLKLYKRLYFEQLKLNTRLAKVLLPVDDGGVYSDFKSIRLAFNYKDEIEKSELIAELGKLHALVGTKMEAEMKKHPDVEALYKEKRGFLGDPSNWNIGGIGNTSSEASLQARRARRPQPGEARAYGNPLIPRFFDAAAAAETNQQIQKIESIRKKLVSEFPDESPLFETGILDVDAVEILRKAQTEPSIQNLADYKAYIRRRFIERFSLRLPDSTIENLQTYYHLANEMAPSLYIREQEPIELASLHEATHGVVSFDFAGQNSRNMIETMRALYQTCLVAKNSSKPTDTVELALELTNEAQMRESMHLEEEKNVVSGSIWASNIPGVGQNIHQGPTSKSFTTSGDDGTFLPGIDLDIKKNKALLRNLRDRATSPSRFRVTFQPQAYTDSRRQIGEDERFSLITTAETIEKQMRENLEASGLANIPFYELKDTLFGVSLRPQENGTVEFDIVIARGPKTLKSPKKGATAQRDFESWQRKIQTAIQKLGKLPQGFVLKEVVDADALAP